jgi:hypothetical protein
VVQQKDSGQPRTPSNLSPAQRGTWRSPVMRIDLTRHWLIWVTWKLVIDSGARESVIASGASLSRRRALEAAHSWQRVYLRAAGLY